MKLAAPAFALLTAFTAASARDVVIIERRPEKVIIVERERRAEPPPIPWAQKSHHKGFVISPYTGEELDVRGVKTGALCNDFSAHGRLYYCP